MAAVLFLLTAEVPPNEDGSVVLRGTEEER